MTRFTTVLTYAGALPFILCAFCPVGGTDRLPLVGETKVILLSYRLLILAFMAGNHWDQHPRAEGEWQVDPATYSTAIMIGLWVGYLALSVPIWLAASVAGTAALLLIDRRLRRASSPIGIFGCAEA